MRIVDKGSFSHQGGRPVNEDALLELGEIPLFAVADGMGTDGAVAAAMAIDQVISESEALQKLFEEVAEDRTSTSRLRIVETFDALFNRAGRHVQSVSGERSSFGMASTLLVSAVVGSTAYVAHVGDSRAYLFRGGKLIRLTEDHSVAEFRYRRGRMTREEYLDSPERQVLYQAVGSGPEVDVDLAEVRLADADVLLFCTDGLIRTLEEDALIEALSSDDLTRAMKGLLAAGVALQPPYNLTAVAVRLEAEEGDATIQEITDAMADCFLFASLSEPELLVVAPYVEEVTWQRGDAITKRDGPADYLGIVLEGLVHEEWSAGSERTLKPGDFFGASGLGGDGIWRRKRTSLESTRILSFSRERFRELVRYKPDLGGRMALALADALRDELRRNEIRLERVARAMK